MVIICLWAYNVKCHIVHAKYGNKKENNEILAWFWIASNTSAESMITSWRSHIAGENWYWDKKEEPYCSYIKIRKTKLFGCNFTDVTERPGRATEGEPIRFVSVIHHIILTNNKVVYKKSPFTQPSRKN